MSRPSRVLMLVLPVLAGICQVNGAVPAQSALYPPAGQWRALHVLNYQSDAALAELAGQIPRLSEMGINVLILEVDYGFAYRSHPELRMGNAPITRAGAHTFAQTCRAHGVRLIPQFACVGHQSWAKKTFSLLTTYPELDLTPGAFPGNEGIYCREWDPLNPKVNEIIFPMLDELIEAFAADAFHVGMDEVFLIGSEHSPSTRGKDPAQVFAQAVNDLHTHLVKKRGVTMLMWADRLIDAQVIDYGKWEASMNGTAPALDLVPKDIILCDWHYEARESYPSVPMFLDKGFRVLPAGWKKVDATRALTEYSRRQEHSKMLGHLFTTWSGRKTWSEFLPLVEGLKLLKGPFLSRRGITHHLGEVDAPQTDPAHVITPAQATRIKYSQQQFVYLDPGETYRFQLKSGVEKTIQLRSVKAHRDPVINLVRRAEVTVDINGKPIRVDFGDGRLVTDYTPYADLAQQFKRPGLHIITVTGQADGLPVTQKLKVLVEE